MNKDVAYLIKITSQGGVKSLPSKALRPLTPNIVASVKIGGGGIQDLSISGLKVHVSGLGIL